MTKDVSIIIASFNTKELLRDCLISIFNNTQGLNFEVIVVDNASKDGTQEMIKKSFQQVKLIGNKKNQGFTKANNQGARVALGRYLFFLNSDTLALKDSIKKLVEFMQKHPKTGIVAPKLLLKNRQSQPATFGPEPNLWQLTFGRFLKNERLDWLSGAAMIVKKEAFKKVGGFDQNFFMYFEDIDLSKRIKEVGYQIAICPTSKIIHLLGKSLKKNRQRKILYYKSQDYFYKKHYGFLVWLILAIIRFPYKLIKTL